MDSEKEDVPDLHQYYSGREHISSQVNAYGAYEA
jgi:hypothetical protein